jgi:hypothetical protein
MAACNDESHITIVGSKYNIADVVFLVWMERWLAMDVRFLLEPRRQNNERTREEKSGR